MEKSKLTKEDAIELVNHIDSIKQDDEMAHAEEDDLYKWFIECCSNGMYQKQESINIANEILKTRKIDFARWCA